MSNRRTFVAFMILMAIGCGGTENDAPKHDPGISSRHTNSAKQPKTESKAARAQSLLNDYLHSLKSTHEELNQITNKDTALSAAKQLHENAKAVKEIAKKLKAIGRLSHAENIAISTKGLGEAQAAHSAANKKTAALLAGGSIAEEADKALRNALVAWGQANIAISEATIAIAPPKTPGKPDWKEFSPPTGDFSIEFPSQPTIGKAGTEPDQFQTASVKRAAINAIGFTLYWRFRTKPFSNAAAADTYIKNQQKGIAAKGKLLSQKNITVAKHDGREFIVTFNESTTLPCRVFVIDELACTLVIQGRDPKAVTTEDAERFFRSFKLMRR